jgi:hypothetical protein
MRGKTFEWLEKAYNVKAESLQYIKIVKGLDDTTPTHAMPI